MITYSTYLVYLILNKKNGLRYYGATSVGLNKRWELHVKSSKIKRKSRCDNRLCIDLRSYGEHSFEVSIVKEFSNQYDMYDYEILMIKEHNTTNLLKGYNIDSGGDYNSLYTDRSEPHYSQIPYKIVKYLTQNKINNMSLINFKVTGKDAPKDMCVFKLLIGKKFFIWKAQFLTTTLSSMEKALETKVKKTPPETELFYLLVSYMKKNRVWNLSVVIVHETKNVHDLIRLEQEELDKAKINPLCLNNSFESYLPKWAIELMSIQPEPGNKKVIAKQKKTVPVKEKEVIKVVAPPFVKKPAIEPVLVLKSNKEEHLEMPDFDVDELFGNKK